MDYSTSQQHQETLESILVSAKGQPEKKPRPADQQALNCPRCDSTNTKFCYYNNYSLSQPRYFCKSCRRYWTKGGTLRNVPVGGGCRKNKRASATSSSSSSKRSQDLITGPIPCLAPVQSGSSDLSLAVARLQKQGGLEGQDFGIWANANFGDAIGMNVNSSFDFDAMRSGVMETHSHHPGLYYGLGNGNPFEGHADAPIAAVKQEAESRVLWGLPWQAFAGDGAAEFGVGWGGVGSSSAWHGLVNSPLM